ncbi:hypothetical protein HZ326_0500 [Fusarium oxysporum f. sp. albedinis]|nr:hypothetical protein HZ326_0500 [Fusarium oxysporum f. sp. albedinis]
MRKTQGKRANEFLVSTVKGGEYGSKGEKGGKRKERKRGKEETRVERQKEKSGFFIEVDYKHERRQLHSNQETDHDTIHVHGQQ